MTDRPILAVLASPADAHRAYRARAEAMNLSRLMIDELATLTTGHAAKLLAPQPLKRLGMQTFFALAAGLGCRIVLEECPIAMARITPRITLRQIKVPILTAKSGRGKYLISKRFLRKIAPRGGRARAAKMTPKERSEHGTRMIKARWSKPTITEITASPPKKAGHSKPK
jgi:hypothetical protein